MRLSDVFSALICPPPVGAYQAQRRCAAMTCRFELSSRHKARCSNKRPTCIPSVTSIPAAAAAATTAAAAVAIALATVAAAGVKAAASRAGCN